jgi:hypothetical protein
MKKWPDIPDVPGLTLDFLARHDLYENATDEELAYSANCTIEEAQAIRIRIRAERFTAKGETKSPEPKAAVVGDDKPWLRIAAATDAEMRADQRRHEDGEPWEGSDEGW